MNKQAHLERTQHKLPAHAMQRRIHCSCSRAIICIAAVPQVLLQPGVVAAADGLCGVMDQLLRQLHGQLPELLTCFDGCCNAGIVRRNDLAAVAPVDLQQGETTI